MQDAPSLSHVAMVKLCVDEKGDGSAELVVSVQDFSALGASGAESLGSINHLGHPPINTENITFADQSGGTVFLVTHFH